MDLLIFPDLDDLLEHILVLDTGIVVLLQGMIVVSNGNEFDEIFQLFEFLEFFDFRVQGLVHFLELSVLVLDIQVKKNQHDDLDWTLTGVDFLCGWLPISCVISSQNFEFIIKFGEIAGQYMI